MSKNRKRITFPLSQRLLALLDLLPKYTLRPKRAVSASDLAGEAGVTTQVYDTPKGKIGCLTLQYFDARNQHREIQYALHRLVTQEKCVALVVDVRDNYQGEFDNAINTASLFFDSGLICSVQMAVRNDQVDQTFYLTGDGVVIDTYDDRSGRTRRQYFGRYRNETANLPVGFITNGATSSAVELLVGVLKDQKRIRTVGAQTFGNCDCRVYVQDAGGYVIEGRNRYFTGPNHECLGSEYNKCAHGIAVDVPADEAQGAPRGNPETDAPLKAALDDLQAQLQ